MKVSSTSESLVDCQAEAKVIGVWKDESLTGFAAEADAATGGLISRMIAAEEISASACSVTNLLGPQGLNCDLLVIVGLGSRDDVIESHSYRVAGSASKSLASKQRATVAFFLDGMNSTERAVCAAIVGCQGQDIMRKELALHPFEKILWCLDPDASETDLQNGIALGESINTTRQLVNLPANKIYPESFAAECETLGKETGFEVEVWDEKKLAEEKCGAMLAVAKASDRPARLVIMRYNGAGDDSAPIALVGKGVTFDSGGLSLKPTAGMIDMKCDMAGAATVVGAVNAMARMKLPVNVIGYCGLVENMIAGNSYRLGDVLTARNGKTVEVHNTDAEGRLVLADVLNIAEEANPKFMVDLATLTGACLVALGTEFVGAMTNDQDLCDQLLSAAENCGELVWQLPMNAFFAEQLKSQIADLKNTGTGRWGGAITAGKFLQEFVEKTPWVHLDIAGPSFADKSSKWIDAGASGCMLMTLVELAQRG